MYYNYIMSCDYVNTINAHNSDPDKQIFSVGASCNNNANYLSTDNFKGTEKPLSCTNGFSSISFLKEGDNIKYVSGTCYGSNPEEIKEVGVITDDDKKKLTKINCESGQKITSVTTTKNNDKKLTGISATCGTVVPSSTDIPDFTTCDANLRKVMDPNVNVSELVEDQTFKQCVPSLYNYCKNNLDKPQCDSKSAISAHKIDCCKNKKFLAPGMSEQLGCNVYTDDECKGLQTFHDSIIDKVYDYPLVTFYSALTLLLITFILILVIIFKRK